MHNVLTGKRITATSAVLALAFIMVMGPSSMAFNAFAQGNDLNQGIGQSQASTQLGFCVSGEDTFISCNNLSVQLQDNEGDNAAAQSSEDDDDDYDGGNSANQGIGQEQDSEQTAACVSGEGTFFSCNNINVQSQDNTGSNAIAQASGDGYDGDGNSLNQGIGQSQSSSQSSQVVSGDDSIFSGNNVNVQSQNNEGSNAAAQSSGGGDDDDEDDNDNGKHHDNDDGGNSANQGIGQEQDSEQDSQVVSGDDSVGSGNNINVQDQNNEGSNAAAQQD